MRTIKVKPLTEASFSKYGVFQDMTDTQNMKDGCIPCGEFYPDLISLPFGGSLSPTVSCCHVFREEKMMVKYVEHHTTTCEGLMALDDDVIFFVGVSEEGRLTADHLEAFYLPKNTFVRMDPLVVHGDQYPVHNEEAHLLCMLPCRTFHNDTVVKELDPDDYIEILP